MIDLAEVIAKGWELDFGEKEVTIGENVTGMCEYPVDRLLEIETVPGLVSMEPISARKSMTTLDIARVLGLTEGLSGKNRSFEEHVAEVQSIKAKEKLLTLILFSQAVYKKLRRRAMEVLVCDIGVMELPEVLKAQDYVIVVEKPFTFRDLGPTETTLAFEMTTRRDIRRRG